MLKKGQYEVAIKIDKRGKERAYRFDRMQVRHYPMGLDEAKFDISTGKAKRMNKLFWED